MSQQLRFRVLGDSLAAGVGCTRVDETLGHLLSDVLRAAGHRVDLGVHAVSGARSTDLPAQVRAVVPTGLDLVLIVIGANDLTSFTPPATGAQVLHESVADLRRTGARVVVATAPDLSVVSHVPPAYRPFVSHVSAVYAQAQADAVVRGGGVVAAVGTDLHERFAGDPSLFSADRFHPSPKGYALIAGALAPHILDAAQQPAA